MNLRTNRWLALAASGLFSASSMAADIVDTAVGSGQFKTLTTALGAADLIGTLKGAGPFTVFAPSDDAFCKLPPGTVETLLKPENKRKLAAILAYHVVPGVVMSKQVLGLKGALSVNGQRIDVKFKDDRVMVDGATVTTTDIHCDNGVIHVIDSVIIPADKTIPETAAVAGTFKTLLAAASAAGLAETLGSAGPFTVFAPTDEAFGKLPQGTVESLLKLENRQKLIDILRYHVISGRVYSEAAVQAKSANTLDGSPVRVSINGGVAMINQSKLILTDLDASNGVIHVIDAVLMPPAKGANARQILEKAIFEGSQLFNAGHHVACASVYQNTMRELMTSSLQPSIKNHMMNVLDSANRQQCPTERSWTLRRGIDQMCSQMSITN